ncbi:hypothetical protein LCGC14_0441410 [marine sediment metagenome]|uniref:Uncharacterized protein n=1 Tax=marine sediment metagenome TaxID=412755 RepID=A0A0F9SR97_9ZZZZ
MIDLAIDNAAKLIGGLIVLGALIIGLAFLLGRIIRQGGGSE